MRNLNAKKQEKRKIRIFYSSNGGGIICVNWLRFVNFLITRIFFSCAEVFIKITNDFLLYQGFLSQDTINSKIHSPRQIEIEFLWDSNYTSLDPWPYWDCSWKNLFSETQHQRWKCHHIKRNNLQLTDTEPSFDKKCKLINESYLKVSHNLWTRSSLSSRCLPWLLEPRWKGGFSHNIRTTARRIPGSASWVMRSKRNSKSGHLPSRRVKSTNASNADIRTSDWTRKNHT